MVSRTPRLNLPRPDPGDPFRRQDFVDTYNILDANPGVHITQNEKTRPSWGPGHVGRVVYEIDNRRILAWDGTDGWVDLRHVPLSWTMSASIEQDVPRPPQNTPPFLIGALTPPRDGRIIIWGSMRWTKNAGSTHSASAWAYVNGANVSLGGTPGGEFARDIDNGTASTANQTIYMPIWGTKEVSSGVEQRIQCKVEAGDYPGSIRVNTLRAFVMLTRTT